MSDRISEIDGYKAMTLFLEYYWKEMNSEDLAVILGGMQLGDKNESLDPAARYIWEKCIDKVTNKDSTHD
jgi:hypothetical protein